MTVSLFYSELDLRKREKRRKRRKKKRRRAAGLDRDRLEFPSQTLK